MASDVNAVVASSGDFYKYRSLGVIVYNDTVMRADSAYLETCYIDDKGDLIFSRKGELATVEEAEKYVEENHIRFSLAFGPILIENGEVCVPYNYVLGEIREEYPRAALCQMEELHYLVVVAGRDEGNYKMGVPTIRDFANQVVLTGCEKAYTLDGGQTGVDGAAHTLSDSGVGITETGAALAVAQDDVLNADLAQHIGSDLTGESTGLLPVAVLGGHADVGTLGGLQSGGNIDKGNAHHHVAGGILHQRLNGLDEGGSLGGGLVHFPVTGNHILPHDEILLYF
jgi:hypothetical protein